MALSREGRQVMTTQFLTFMDKLDPSKRNSAHYGSFFASMSDKKFEEYMKKYFNDSKAYLTLDVVSFEHDLKMEMIEKAADFINVELYEHVVMPFYSEDKSNPIVTPFKVPVGFIHMKRVQQTAMKKNSTSINISQRDSKTNQVIGDDKNARQALEENFAMATTGAMLGIKEFMSFRSDDMVMKEAAYTAARKDGYISMKDLPDSVTNKSSLGTFDVYLIGMGYKSDLVTPGYLLTKTLK